MIIWYIDYENIKLKYETYSNVGNLMALYEELDGIYSDGWFETKEEAQEALNNLKV